MFRVSEFFVCPFRLTSLPKKIAHSQLCVSRHHDSLYHELAADRGESWSYGFLVAYASVRKLRSRGAE